MDSIHILRCSKCSSFQGYNEKHLPVVAFGNPNAPIMLLSLNPSYAEYKPNRNGQSPLIGLTSGNRANAREDELIAALRRQEKYFTTGLHYKRWFNAAERFLNQLKTSQDETVSFGIDERKALVSNVDIVKCATNPTWRKLGEYQDKYANNCIPFLVEQLFSPSTKVVFLNGSGVADLLVEIGQRTRMFNVSIKESKPIRMVRIKRDGTTATTSSCYYTGFLRRNGSEIAVTGTTGRISEDNRPVFFNHDGTRAQNSDELFSAIEKIIQAVV